MTRIHLLTPSLVPGDAVSNDVLGMARCLRRHGHKAHVYASRCHPSLRDRVRRLADFRRHLDSTMDLMIYHHSVGWRAGLECFERTRNHRVLRYHNVTPPAFYRPYSALYVAACEEGADQTRRLLAMQPELYLPDSHFNSSELTALGAPTKLCRTVPPFHRVGSLDTLPIDSTLARSLQEHPTLLFVGRLTPNKGHIHLIRSLAHYRHYLGGRADLTLVGSYDPGLLHYREELRTEIRRLRVEGQVHFAGRVSGSQLKTYYRHASVFVCASEHEGFCVPLVEAMYYGLPIVACGGSAVGGTLGDAALLWPNPSPPLFAQSIRRLETDVKLRALIVQRQRDRFALRYTLPTIGAGLMRALRPFLDQAPVSPDPATSQ